MHSSNTKKSLKSLKIGFVLDDGLDQPDGVQQYILALGEWLTSQGHDVHYLVGQTVRNDITNLHSLSRNLRVSSNGNRMSIPLPTQRRRLKRLLAAEQFDILHVQVPYSPFMGGRLISLVGPRTAVIGTFHILPVSGIFSFGTSLLGLWSQPSLRRFGRMLSVSAAAAEFAKQTFKVDSEILPNVVDYQRFHGAKRLKQYNDAKPTILFLGRLVPRKGSLLLLQAVARLTQWPDLPDFRVVVCGRGPELAKLEKFINEHSLANYVELVGFVTEAEKPSYYASADIAVFPSRGGESFGIVLLEAMASGRAAVLAGDNPGYRSVMEPKPELLFNPLDANELASKLADYLTNSQRRKQMAAWGASYARDFDVAVVGKQLLSVYNRALHKRRHQ